MDYNRALFTQYKKKRRFGSNLARMEFSWQCRLKHIQREELKQLSRVRNAISMLDDDAQTISLSGLKMTPNDNTGDNCVICTETLSYVDRIFDIPCGHLFHARCLDEWLVIKSTCPICRTSIDQHGKRNRGTRIDAVAKRQHIRLDSILGKRRHWVGFGSKRPRFSSSSSKTIEERLDEERCLLRQREYDLENHIMVHQFHLDSANLMRKFADARREAAHQLCADIHREFLDQFGHELQPKMPEQHRPRRYKKARRDFPLPLPPETCAECHKSECVIDNTSTGDYVCTNCGSTKRYGVAHGVNGLTFEATKNLQSEPYTYKPISHLEDLLMQVQGKSGRDIPEALLQRVKLEFRKTRVPTADITPHRVRHVLRKIGFSNYYDEVTSMAHKLNPAFKPIIIKDEHYETLKMMFVEVYRQFPDVVRMVNPKRRNFLSYHGFAKNMCIFLGYHDYVHAFTSLKSQKKRNDQRKILQKIFEAMNFEFRHSE